MTKKLKSDKTKDTKKAGKERRETKAKNSLPEEDVAETSSVGENAGPTLIELIGRDCLWAWKKGYTDEALGLAMAIARFHNPYETKVSKLRKLAKRVLEEEIWREDGT